MRTILIGFVASFGHAATQIIQKLFVFTDALDIDRVAAAKAGSNTCAGAIRQTPDTCSFLQTQGV